MYLDDEILHCFLVTTGDILYIVLSWHSLSEVAFDGQEGVNKKIMFLSHQNIGGESLPESAERAGEP
jgi:hypothetical protein